MKNSKKIAKNTIVLYIRMIVLTFIALFTSRIVLRALGIEDFGIYNVVAGIVEFATIFTGSLTAATQRFLSYDLGKKDLNLFNRDFCSLCNIFILVCIILAVIVIPTGLWMVNDFLVIPSNRIIAASWLLTFSVITFILSTITIPYMSAIIAYERMEVYAYFSIAEGVMKLLSAIVLFVSEGVDKLIIFAIVTLMMRLLLNIFIVIYCNRKFIGCEYSPIMDLSIMKQQASFSGWSLLGATSSTLTTQGHTILLNLFFGPILNAAKGIADKVKGFSLTLSQNIFMAVTPQITKSYASKDFTYSRQLVYLSSRLSFMLIFVICAPMMTEMKPLLELWLGKNYVSSESIAFSIYGIVFVLITTLEAPLTKVVQATGNVKTYEIIVGFVTLMFIPISYISLRLGCSAIVTFAILNILYGIIIIYRVYIVSKIIMMSIADYMKEVVIPIIEVCVVFCLIINFSYSYCLYIDSWLIRIILWYCCTAVVVISFGIKGNEKRICIDVIRNKIIHKK